MDKTKIVKDVFNRCAEDYVHQFMDVGLYHASFDKFCEEMPNESASVLEIGCGPGNITQYLLEKHSDFRILGIDLSENMVAFAQKNNPQATFLVMDCRHLGEMTQKYDGILCGFCLPYLSRAEAAQLIKDCSELLNENGILYLSTMEDDYEKSGLKTSSSGEYSLYMYYHEAAYLTELLEANRFSIILSIHQDYPTKDGTKTTDLILIGKKETKPV